MSKRRVIIETVTVGQSFGTAARIRDAKSGKSLRTTQTRPLGFTAAAEADAQHVAATAGWDVVA